MFLLLLFVWFCFEILRKEPTVSDLAERCSATKPHLQPYLQEDFNKCSSWLNHSNVQDSRNRCNKNNGIKMDLGCQDASQYEKALAAKPNNLKELISTSCFLIYTNTQSHRHTHTHYGTLCMHAYVHVCTHTIKNGLILNLKGCSGWPAVLCPWPSPTVWNSVI